MFELLQLLINGLAVGSTYALIALGYTLVFGVLKLINFAHGEVYMLGAYTGMYVAYAMGFDHNPSFFALLLTTLSAMVVCAGLGWFIERFAYRPLRRAPRINILITAVGVSLLLQFSAQALFGSEPRFFPQIYQPTPSYTGHAQEESLVLSEVQIMIFVLAAILMLILQYIVFFTRFGRAMRAISFNHDLARLQGIPVDRIVSGTFCVGAALAGAAGVLVSVAYPKIDPFMGVLPGLKAFAAAVLGGIGNVAGAVLGALILGLSEQFLVAYGASTFRDGLAFGILILILLVKPSGLLGKATLEKV